MKNRFLWASALTLAATVTSQLETRAITNGVIVITTRKGQDLSWGTGDSGNVMGPGQTSQGDVAMAALLGDHGYTCRLILDAELNPVQNNPFTTLPGNQEFYLLPANGNFNAALVINSGTSGSADIGAPNTNDVPIMMGEHSCISDVVRTSHNSLYMYSGTGSDDVKDTEPAQGASQYMVVIAPNHPIMQGIPLDAEGRVKIFRDRYPEENAHVPTGGKPNYEYAWTTINASQAASGTTVIGLLGGNTNRACFATADVGAQLASTSNDPDHPWQIAFADNKAHQRLVHWLVNDQGSGGSRRCFDSLTDIGRVIFIRTAKWAMGEGLAPYEPLNINVSALSNTSLKIQWTASVDKNYKILASADITTPLFNWKTLAQDIPGVSGTIQKTLTIAAAPQAAYLRVVAVP